MKNMAFIRLFVFLVLLVFLLISAQVEEIRAIAETQDPLISQIIQQLTAREDAIKDIEVRYELIRISATTEVEKHGKMMGVRTAGETLFIDNLWRLAGMLEYREETQMYELIRHSFVDSEYREQPYAPILRKCEDAKPLKVERLGFDGEKTIRYTESRRNVTESPPMVKILEGKTEDFEGFIGYKNFLFVPEAEWDVIEGSVSKEEFFSSPCIRFVVKQSSSANIVYQYWCDLSRGYTPVRIDKVINGKVWQVCEVSELQQCGEKLWLPINGIIRTFINGKPIAVYLLRVKELNVNHGLMPQDFRVEYDGEISVEDLTKNVQLQTALERLADMGGIILVTDIFVLRLLKGITPKQIRNAQTQAEIIDILKNYQINIQPSSKNKDIWYVFDSSKKPPIETGEITPIKKLHADVLQEDSNIKHFINLINSDLGVFCELIAKKTHSQIAVNERASCHINLITGRGLTAHEVIDAFESSLRLCGLNIQEISDNQYRVGMKSDIPIQ